MKSNPNEHLSSEEIESSILQLQSRAERKVGDAHFKICEACRQRREELALRLAAEDQMFSETRKQELSSVEGKRRLFLRLRSKLQAKGREMA